MHDYIRHTMKLGRNSSMLLAMNNKTCNWGLVIWNSNIHRWNISMTILFHVVCIEYHFSMAGVVWSLLWLVKYVYRVELFSKKQSQGEISREEILMGLFSSVCNEIPHILNELGPTTLLCRWSLKQLTSREHI